MVRKILSYLVPIIMLLLVIGIALQYYISSYEPEQFVCHKGKLLMQIEGTMYTKAKGVSCEFEKGMLILEEQS
jgi:hypothetical protein